MVSEGGKGVSLACTGRLGDSKGFAEVQSDNFQLAGGIAPKTDRWSAGWDHWK